MGQVLGNAGVRSGRSLNERGPSARVFALAALALSEALAAQPPHVGAEHAARVPTGALAENAVTDGGTFVLRLRTVPHPVRLNEYFELVVEVGAEGLADDGNPFWVGAEARMPAHEHGMNTLPRREDLGAGRFLFRGLLFHMAGEWEIVFDVAKGRVREHATAPIVVE